MWKLYWVEVPWEKTDDCFVVAKNSRSARSVEYKQWGEGYDEISAEYVLDIPDHIEKKAVERHKEILQKRINDPHADDDIRILKNKFLEISSIEDIWPDWADHRPAYGEHWLLNELGAERYYRERRLITEIDGWEYVTASFEDYLGGMIELKNPDERNIVSVKDFKEKIKTLENDKLNVKNLIYRGQRDAYWRLQCGIERYVTDGLINKEERIQYEKRLLKQFKEQSLPYLEGGLRPQTDWEWLIVGQHYGLPTMLLDWTRNPLCALYFAVRGNEGDRDGIVYAYNHARPAIDISNQVDPTRISHIELIEPPKLSPRVMAQESLFTAEPLFHKRDDVWKKSTIIREWHVCATQIISIQEDLSDLGINEDTLFPSLDSICHNLKANIASE